MGVVRITCLLILVPASMAGCSHPTRTSESLFLQKYGDFAYCEMTVVKQSHSKSCASASLAAVLNYWGVQTSEQQVLEEYGAVPQNGFSIAQLLAIAKSKNLQAYAFSMNPEPIEKLTEQIHKGRPIICVVKIPEALYLGYDIPLFGSAYRRLSWMMGPRKNHFIVVFGIKDQTFLIMDPAFGFTTFSRKHLADAWAKQKNVVILCARASQQRATQLAGGEMSNGIRR